jgi:hypothetical protein
MIDDICELPSNEKISLRYQNGKWPMKSVGDLLANCQVNTKPVQTILIENVLNVAISPLK